MPVIVPTMEDWKALDARVSALEAGGGTPVPPDPPDPPDELTPSPDGAEASMPGTVLVSAALNAFELGAPAAGKTPFGIYINGTLDPVTHNVDLLYMDEGELCQRAQGWWYRYNDAAGTWSSTSDPTVPVPIPPDPPDPPQPGTGPAIMGCYTRSPGGETWNFGNGYDSQLLQGIGILESELGHTINCYDYFPTWGDQNWWGANLKNMIWACAQTGAKGKSLIPCVGIKLFWSNTPPQNYGWGDAQGFRDNINGKWDSVWQQMVDAVADNGYTTGLFRVSYEHNFSFMCDSPGWDSNNQQLWKQAFEHVSGVIRARGKAKGIAALTMFNPTLGGGSQPVESFAPDPGTYDICSADAYNSYYGSGNINDANARKDFWTNTYYGAKHHLALAKAHNRPLLWPETGAGTRGDGHAIKNDTPFWDWSAAQSDAARAQSTHMQGYIYWDVPASDINAAMSNGAQPPCTATCKTHVTAGSMVADPLWTPAGTRGAPGPVEVVPPSIPFPLSNPPRTPLQVDPKFFCGRDPRAIKEWVMEYRRRVREHA